jgi:hypothetical protein
MLTGIALAVADVPLVLIEQEHLEPRRHDRGGEGEIQFLFRDAERILPVWHEGQLQLVRWSNRRGECRALPCTGWTWHTTVESGDWADRASGEVVIPATLGLDRGVWFCIRQGVRGLLVADEKGVDRVYLLVERASHYYRMQTRPT